MRYSVVFRSSAQKELRKLPKATYLILKAAIDKLAGQPRPAQARKMIGEKNRWRLRSGSYRVIYSINDRVLTVEIIRVAHRKNAYKK